MHIQIIIFTIKNNFVMLCYVHIVIYKFVLMVLRCVNKIFLNYYIVVVKTNIFCICVPYVNLGGGIINI